MSMDTILKTFLSLDEVNLLLRPWVEKVNLYSNYNFQDRLSYCIEYFKYLDDLVKREILYIPYASSFALLAIKLLKKSGDNEIDNFTTKMEDILIDLRLPNLMANFTPRDRSLDDWKIIEEFIQKYSKDSQPS